MNDMPRLVVMLTHHDLTVTNTREIFEICACSGAEYFGMKEKPLPPDELKALYARMKELGKTTVLESVTYTEDEGMESARRAAECGCDILMGTVFSDSINLFCLDHNIRYMPFVGDVAGRPSVLGGSADSIIAEAKSCLDKGVFGVDLLAYRFEGDHSELLRRFMTAIKAPVCIAGSVDSSSRLDEVRRYRPWGFTIGGAFFENRFGGAIPEQIDSVISYMKNEPHNAVGRGA